MRSVRTILLAVAASAALLLQPAAAGAQELTVFAAASMKNALDEAAATWTKQGRTAPRISYAASSALAKQIENGAPADIFLSADLDWMDYLARRDLIDPATRTDLLANRIVLVAPADAARDIALKPGLDFSAALGQGRLAMANVDAVPAGKYGKAALGHLGAWDGVKDRVAQAENVRAALLLVARGEAPLGIVYATDAAAEPKVRIVGAFPEESHPRIIYPVAALRASKHPDARDFLAFLRSSGARPSFDRQGFTVLAKPPGAS